MKVAILETVKAFAGFELEFDRIIIEELKKQGHEPVFFLPEGTVLDHPFEIPVIYLHGGRIVSYDHVHGLQKLWCSFQRERRRVRWFDSAADMAAREKVGAILLTTATHRYLRSLLKSRLRNAAIPVHFIFLGVNPQEKPKFLDKAMKCLLYKNIHLDITTLRDDFAGQKPANVKLVLPPVLLPDSCQQENTSGGVLRIGFFGHYRKGEKNLEWLLHAIEEIKFSRPVQFVLQIAPTTDTDDAEVQALVKAYADRRQVEFIPHKLIGDAWYEAIQSVDVVFLPYTAERYRYNWSAIYFTAIGCGKPVLVTRVLNPEVMEQFHIGEYVDLADEKVFQVQLKEFVDTYDENKMGYQAELQRAMDTYSRNHFLRQILSEQ